MMMAKNGVFRTPTGLRVRAQSYAKLEAAADVLRPQLPRLPGNDYKLDCGRIFEETLPRLGYQYGTVEIDEVQDCAAFTIPEEKIVFLRTDVYDKLCAENVFGRSTVIHELSHLALHHHLTLYRGNATNQHEFFEDSEWQAKALTAALMMPLEAVTVARSPAELAEICGTSVESATYRSQRLVKAKLLKPSHSLWRYFENEKAF